MGRSVRTEAMLLEKDAHLQKLKENADSAAGLEEVALEVRCHRAPAWFVHFRRNNFVSAF